ncbi:MAG: septum formation protein Maf [Bacilli bacterium]|nr:septum formation protein Maf [Bacilli bacterium]
MKIILASKSKRRQELLKMMNIEYEVIISDKEEIQDKNLSPLENCKRISLEKAIDVKDKTEGDRIIISCDTIVVKDNEIYGKPRDYNDAFYMLKLFSNTSHEVISCLTVIKIKNGEEKIYTDYDKCLVYIDKMTNEEINDWIEKNNPYDKAGGYAIQEEFGKYITKIEGDYYTIVGLPINKLYNILKEITKEV